MRSKLPPKRGLSPDSALPDRFKVKPHRTCLGLRCFSTNFGISPKPKGRKISDTGFTLIEVIAALLIISVLAAIIFHTTGGGLWRTARGVGECRALFELQGRMEQIVQIYKKQLNDGNGAVDLTDFRDAIVSLPDVNVGGTGFLSESGSNFSLTPGATSLFMVTLSQGNQRIACVFAGD